MRNNIKIETLLVLIQMCHVASIKIIFGGDVSFYGPIDKNFKLNSCPYDDMFNAMAPVFKSADEVILNLETTLGNEKDLKPYEMSEKSVTFVSNPKTLASLKNVGVTRLSLANNHLLDFGSTGAKATIKEIVKAKMNYFGITYEKKALKFQKPLILEKDGVKVCILSYCYNKEGCKEIKNGSVGPPLFSADFVIKEVQNIKKRIHPHAIAIYVHMGQEYNVLTKTRTDLFKNLIKINPYIDAMVMSHVHIPSSHFYYNNTLFTGHLGNLFFPMHMLENIPIKEIPGVKSKKVQSLMKEWLLQVKYLRNESSRGKLVRLEFDRNGLVKKSSKYMYSYLRVDKDNCVRAYPQSKKWTRLCGKRDPYCEGTTKCNYITCKQKPNKYGEQ